MTNKTLINFLDNVCQRASQNPNWELGLTNEILDNDYDQFTPYFIDPHSNMSYTKHPYFNKISQIFTSLC